MGGIFMRVLVTGANGFLGSHVVLALLRAGYDVRAFLLHGTSAEALNNLSCETFRGDLLCPEDIDKALDSCDYLIHTAAITDIWPARNRTSWKINFDVVKLLAAAVRKNPVRKMIHVGTANSFGFGTLSHPGTEEDGYACGKYGLDYMDSKKAAQDYLLGEVRDYNLPVVILNPTFMIGENDSKPGTGEMILSVMAGKVPGCAKGGRCFAAVKDVAQACVNALEKGRVGQCYITGGTNLCYRDFFALIGQVAKVRPPRRIVPTFLSVPMAAVMEGISRLRRRKPKLTVAMAKISGDGHYYSSLKAIRELDYPQTKLEEALSEAILWYRDHGYIPPRRQS